MSKGAMTFWGLHFALDALLGLLFYQWLQIPDAKLWQIGLTMLSGAVLAFVLLWLHSATFAFFGEAAGSVGAAWRRGLRRLPLFAVWALVFGVVLTFAAKWTLAWVAVAALLLPLAAAAVNGMPAALAAYKRWWYWVGAVVLLFVGVYVPLKLVGWVPELSGVAMQMVSFVVRAGIGYLLFVTAWLMLAYVTAGGRPWATQPRTAALP